MSFRPLESNEKDDFGYMMDGQNMTLDGILDLHVDDFVFSHSNPDTADAAARCVASELRCVPLVQRYRSSHCSYMYLG